MTRTYPRSIHVPGSFDTIRVESFEQEAEVRARLSGAVTQEAAPQPKRRGRPRGSNKRNAGQ